MPRCCSHSLLGMNNMIVVKGPKPQEGRDVRKGNLAGVTELSLFQQHLEARLTHFAAFRSQANDY